MDSNQSGAVWGSISGVLDSFRGLERAPKPKIFVSEAHSGPYFLAPRANSVKFVRSITGFTGVPYIELHV